MESCTTKSDECCRYLLFSIAQSIGPHTLKIVQYFCPSHISEQDCMMLDEIIASNIFTDEEIEEAARITLDNDFITFGKFQVTLIWK